MKSITRVLAVSSVLCLAFTACGDDDDATADVTTEEAVGEATDTDAADTTTAVTETGATGSLATPEGDSPALTTSPVSVSDDVAADCAAFEGLADDLPELEQPAPGGDIPEEFSDAIRATAEDLEDLELSSDEGQAARDAFVDDLNTLADADTMTAELQALGESEEILSFGQLCSSLETD